MAQKRTSWREHYYPNLEAMMRSHGVSALDISKALKKSYCCTKQKLNGVYCIKLEEAFAIRRALGAEKIDLEELFLHL